MIYINNEERQNPKVFFNVKLKGKQPIKRLSSSWEHVRKDSTYEACPKSI
jgi:hypothetical protein